MIDSGEIRSDNLPTHIPWGEKIMSLRIKSYFTAALLVLGFGSTPALSQQDIGWYAGASIGQSMFDTPAVPAGFAVSTTDDEDTGFKIYGGYQFTRNWAVEVGYVDLGEFAITGPTFTAKAEVTGLSVAAVGTMPLNGNFSLFGKAGLFVSDIKTTSTGALALIADDGTDPLLGIGGRYNLNRNLAVQVEWEHIASDEAINVISVGLRYKF